MQKEITNATDEKQIKAKKKHDKHLDFQLVDDLKYLLKTPQFRRFAWRYMSTCGVFTMSFDSDVNQTMFNEGRRSVGNKIMTEITTNVPYAFLQMMEEANKEKEVNNG